MTEGLGEGLALIANPGLWVVILLAGAYGLFIGAIPGLTATMAAALLVPFAFFLEPLPAIAAIVTMSALVIFAGDIPSALLRMPGTPANAAYVEDAYGQTRAGHGARVLGVCLTASVIGGIIGAVVLAVAAPALAEFAVRFTSFEYFWVAVLGLSAAVIISRGSQVKGTLALLFGLFLSTVGLDITLGYQRFTFGNVDLLEGVNFIPAMIGLFGFAEILRNVAGRRSLGEHTPFVTTRMLRDSLSVLRRYRRGVARGAGIGTFVGMLPGAGADVAAWVSYAATKNASRESHQFGRGSGHVEPVASAGATNSTSLASAYVPTLVFGIPGDTITAILIGVLTMKGLQPGPDIFTEQAGLVYAVYLVFLIANLIMLPLGYLAIRSSGLIVRVPPNLLMPIIFAFCVVGSYAVNNSLFDVGVMLVMGIIGYLMGLGGFPVAPVVLGLVLGPIVERNFMQSVIATDWNLVEFFTRPISAVLMTITILLWLGQLVRATGLVTRMRTRMRGEKSRSHQESG